MMVLVLYAIPMVLVMTVVCVATHLREVGESSLDMYTQICSCTRTHVACQEAALAGAPDGVGVPLALIAGLAAHNMNGYSLQGGAVGGGMQWIGVVSYNKLVYNIIKITTPCFHCTPL